MMKRIILFPFLVILSLAAAAQSPEERYQEYITPEVRAVLERSEQAERENREAEAAAKARKSLMFAVSLAIALIPLGYIGSDIIRHETWKENPSGTARALGTGLAGGAVLFAVNYGIILLKVRMGDAFNIALAFLVVAALAVGSVWLMKKK